MTSVILKGQSSGMIPKNFNKVFSPNALILSAMVLIILAPVIYYHAPWFANGADVFYAKAKLLQVQQGHLFTDPITGYDTFHPPLFHIVLYALTTTGLSADSGLTLMTILQVILIFFFTYRIIKSSFNAETALYTGLLTLFIFEFMGSRNILLASSFNFSIPFFLWGLSLYLKSGDSRKRIIAISFLWGIAFLLSPVYLFLLIAIAVRDYITFRSYKRLGVASITFLITITLFIIQAITVYSQGLEHSRTFALWRGIPGMNYWGDFWLTLFTTNLYGLSNIFGWLSILMVLLFFATVAKMRRIDWLTTTAFIAFVFTYYNFSGQYAIRMKYFLFLPIVAQVIYFARYELKSRYPLVVLLTLMIPISIYAHYHSVMDDYKRWDRGYKANDRLGKDFWQNMDTFLENNEFILSTKNTYFRYVMIYKPIHMLGAYKTLDYFQLDSTIADEMETDYNLLTSTTDIDVVNNIADKYHARTAVFSGPDYNSQLFQTLAPRWPMVYRDKYFAVFKKP